MSGIAPALLAAAALGALPPGSRPQRPILADLWVLLPGVSYVQEIGTPNERATYNGGGMEVSVVRHLGEQGEWVVGGLVQAEKLRRWRSAIGAEVGYEFFGVELSAARDFSSDVTPAQWSLQLAPYASAGFLWVSARWVLALTDRHAAGALGDSAMLLVGFKIPIPLGVAGDRF